MKLYFTDLLDAISSLGIVYISAPQLPVRGGAEWFNRLFSLNRWLSAACTTSASWVKLDCIRKKGQKTFCSPPWFKQMSYGNFASFEYVALKLHHSSVIRNTDHHLNTVQSFLMILLNCGPSFPLISTAYLLLGTLMFKLTTLGTEKLKNCAVFSTTNSACNRSYTLHRAYSGFKGLDV